MDINRSIVGILIIAGAMVLAVFIGVGLVVSQIETLLQFLVVLFFIICIALGRRIWLLMPFMASLSFTLTIPGSPSTTQLGQLITLTFCLALFLMRKIDFRLSMGEVEFWTVLLFICVAQVYIRNPVGLNILGGDSVGARPYVLFVLDLLTGILFMGLRVPLRELRWLFPVTIVGGVASFVISIVGFMIPSIGAYYGAVNVNGDRQLQQVSEGEATRIAFAGVFARNLALWISAVISPLRAIFSIKFAPLVIMCLVLALASGFRNVLITVGLIYLISLYYRSGFISVLIASLGGAFGVVALALINIIAPLPANMQRVLTFLPGTWDQRYIDDAEGSTAWRVIIWKEALFTPNWIENKMIGDGLGMSQKELRYMKSLSLQDIGGEVQEGKLTTQQEMMLITGGYHSGPVSVVRTIGYLGLVVVITAFIRLAILAHKLILRYRNTEWYSLCLLIGIPLLYGPIFIVFIYGTFSGAVTSIVIGGSMMRFIKNNLPPLSGVNRASSL